MKLRWPAPGIHGVLLVLSVFTEGHRPLEDWWRLSSCRSITPTLASFSSNGTSSCQELAELYPTWSTAADYIEGYSFVNAGLLRFIITGDTTGASSMVIPANTEFVVARLSFPRRASPSGGPCAGCEKPACISFDHIVLDGADQSQRRDVYGLRHRTIRWQSGPLNTGTSTTPSSWGRIKSLYR